jgi:hypothetical protein
LSGQQLLQLDKLLKHKIKEISCRFSLFTRFDSFRHLIKSF